ncbi:hypothetical protein H5410_046480 [Solanum commersonii]|uniref:Uncharacterized protein n=1 Tax=Solanum commersonii TaxID=4109 RepID=A0A9J5XFS8_SOLCO|nr:hypothetical protein H5410_046480 [Solanum commersonii]
MGNHNEMQRVHTLSMQLYLCLRICITADHSTQLVGMADTLGDPPFGRFHLLVALAFSIFAL